MQVSDQIEIEIEVELSEDERTAIARSVCQRTEIYDNHVVKLKDDRAQGRKELKDMKAEIDREQKEFLIGRRVVKTKAVGHINMELKTFEVIHEGKLIRSRDLTTEEIEQFGSKPMFDEPESAHEDIGHVRKSETKRGAKKDIVSGVN